MTISIGEALQLEKVESRATIDWMEIIYRIVKSLKYYSINEIQEFFVHNKVQNQRIKLVMDEAFEKGILDRRIYDNMHIYGPSEEFERYVRMNLED